MFGVASRDRGTDSYSMSCTASISASTANVPWSVSCPMCIPSTISGYFAQVARLITSDSVTIKDRTVLVGAQNIATSLGCTTTPGTSTSGSSSNTTSPAFTTCASSRQVLNFNDEVLCTTTHFICSGPCSLPTPVSCSWSAAVEPTWLTLPPCTHTVTLLDYDTSLEFRHGRVTANTGTSTLWTGYSPNGDPYAWADLNSGIAAARAVVRWQDSRNVPFGVLYDAGGGSRWLLRRPGTRGNRLEGQ